MSNLCDSEQLAYCGWTKNSEDLCESSSGGIFYSIAKEIVKRGGYVVGAMYTDDYKSVKHIVSNNIDEIKDMRGSKYSQSSYIDVINKIEEKCNDGYYVLFSGTPCQCYVVRSKIKSDKLICIDLICNGLQDHRILQNEISRLEELKNSKITAYSMRYKKDGLHLPIYMHAEFENGEIIEDNFYKTNLGKIYGARLALQKSCYKCRFKGLERYGDITLGDYRGFDSLKDKDVNQYGASTIIINTKRGHKLIGEIKDNLVMLQAKNMKEVVFSNSRIVISGCKPSNNEIHEFWKLFNENGIEEASKKSEMYLSRVGNAFCRALDRAILIKYYIFGKFQ